MRDVQIIEMRYGLGHRTDYIAKFFNISRRSVEVVYRKYKPKFNNPQILVMDSKINGSN